MSISGASPSASGRAFFEANGPESQRAVATHPHLRRGSYCKPSCAGKKAIQAIRRAVHRSIDADSEAPQLLSDRFATSLEAREEGARRALVGWPAPSRLAWRRRIQLFAKASALHLKSPWRFSEGARTGAVTVEGHRLRPGKAFFAFLASIAGDADRERLGLGRKPPLGGREHPSVTGRPFSDCHLHLQRRGADRKACY